jgi:probable HAF family extracellular repeat protein
MYMEVNMTKFSVALRRVLIALPIVFASIGLVMSGCDKSTQDPLSSTLPSSKAPITSLSMDRDHSSKGREIVFTSIDFPGAVSTVAQGINAGGQVVGWYNDAANILHGFLMNGGSFTPVDFPGATATDARGIGPGGEIVGVFYNAAGTMNGYRVRHGKFTVANYPGHLNTIAQRITPRGEIVGCFHDNNMTSTMFGMTLTAHGANSIATPASMNNGITPNGRTIAGSYTLLGKGRGYLIKDGVFTPFDVPSSIFTAAWDISPTGEVVGAYRSPDNMRHGFLWNNEGFTAIDYPGASDTRAFGINAGGDIVGDYVVSGSQRHGFLASRTHEHER